MRTSGAVIASLSVDRASAAVGDQGNGRATVIETAPGADVSTVLAATEAELTISPDPRV